MFSPGDCRTRAAVFLAAFPCHMCDQRPRQMSIPQGFWTTNKTCWANQVIVHLLTRLEVSLKVSPHARSLFALPLDSFQCQPSEHRHRPGGHPHQVRGRRYHFKTARWPPASYCGRSALRSPASSRRRRGSSPSFSILATHALRIGHLAMKELWRPGSRFRSA